jgi:hypothetical protein
MNVYIYTDSQLPYKYSYDFRNKTTTQVTNDWWNTYRDVRSWNVDSNWIHVVWYPWYMWKLIDNSYFQNAKKITLKSYFNIQTYSYNLFLQNISWSTLTWYTGDQIDTRQSFRKIFIYGSWSNVTTSIPYWVYEDTVVFDLVNKTAKESMTWFSDITASLSDTNISNIRNNMNSISIWFYNDLNSNTASYVRDISLTIEY